MGFLKDWTRWSFFFSLSVTVKPGEWYKFDSPLKKSLINWLCRCIGNAREVMNMSLQEDKRIVHLARSGTASPRNGRPTAADRRWLYSLMIPMVLRWNLFYVQAVDENCEPYGLAEQLGW